MIEIRNLYLHKGEENIRERINEGKIKYFLNLHCYKKYKCKVDRKLQSQLAFNLLMGKCFSACWVCGKAKSSLISVEIPLVGKV